MDTLANWSSTGSTVGWIGLDGIAIGIFAVGDQIRPEAAEAVRDLRVLLNPFRFFTERYSSSKTISGIGCMLIKRHSRSYRSSSMSSLVKKNCDAVLARLTISTVPFVSAT